MKCPKCSAEFETVKYENISIDRCSGCQGLWFDMLEKEDLKHIEGSELIDIGNAEVGKLNNVITKIDCPVCDVAMINMVDKDQMHIHYEYCPSCYGVFFDAGEFRDFKEYTVIERFKQMLDTLRTNLK